MTTDHRAEAVERLRASDYQRQEGDFKGARLEASAALVHATLARNEEGATSTADLRDALTLLRRRESAVRQLIAAHIVNALKSQNAGRQQAALRLASDLDEAGANLDDLINEELADEGWTPAPNPMNLCADVPSPVRRVIAGQLASMLLGSDGEAVQGRARNFATALKNEGVDLDDAIKTRIHELTFGYSDEPPF